MVRAPVYLDRSSAYVVRSLGKLETLLDLPSLLSDQEYETLLAAQYIRALRLCEDDLTAAYSKISEGFPMAFAWESAVLAADLTDADPAPIAGLHKLDGVRCGFLAALLRLSDALDLDQAAITTATGSLGPPVDGSPVENWLAYLTRRAEVSRGGSVTFHLAVPVAQKALAPNFRRNVALIFDACWHNLRAVLSVHGVAVARAPMQSAPSRELRAVPNAVLLELDRATAQAEAAIRDLQHFGQEPPCPVPLEILLPLPYSALARPLRFTFHPDLRHKLRLWSENEADARELTANQPGGILLDSAFLSPPGTRYRWALQRDDGDFFSEVASGLVWQLSPADQMRLEAGESLPDLRYALLLMLGLHNDLLRELWPKLVSGEASRGECACVYDALLASYDWLYTNAPESSQVELIRNFGNWIHKEILNKKGNQL